MKRFISITLIVLIAVLSLNASLLAPEFSVDYSIDTAKVRVKNWEKYPIVNVCYSLDNEKWQDAYMEGNSFTLPLTKDDQAFSIFIKSSDEVSKVSKLTILNNRLPAPVLTTSEEDGIVTVKIENFNDYPKSAYIKYGKDDGSSGVDNRYDDDKSIIKLSRGNENVAYSFIVKDGGNYNGIRYSDSLASKITIEKAEPLPTPQLEVTYKNGCAFLTVTNKDDYPKNFKLNIYTVNSDGVETLVSDSDKVALKSEEQTIKCTTSCQGKADSELSESIIIQPYKLMGYKEDFSDAPPTGTYIESTEEYFVNEEEVKYLFKYIEFNGDVGSPEDSISDTNSYYAIVNNAKDEGWLPLADVVATLGYEIEGALPSKDGIMGIITRYIEDIFSYPESRYYSYSGPVLGIEVYEGYRWNEYYFIIAKGSNGKITGISMSDNVDYKYAILAREL